ncbi:MAG: PD-(D/E)XK nuclease family protein, partial [Clostridia bacterium]
MKLTVLACPDHGALETAVTGLMKEYTDISRNGAAVIVPDQSSFSEEERIIKAFGTVGLGNPEVLSFKRLFYNLSGKFPSGRKRLTPSAREMAVAYSLNNIDKADFRLFSGVVKKRELASTVSGLITGFKRYGVTADKLGAADKGLEQNSPLQKKIHDCFMALESYDRLMDESGLCDADDDMRELARILELEDCDFFSGKTVFIRHFSDLNRLQLQCVGGICKKAEGIFAAVCWEDRPEFATTKKLIDGLKRTALENGCQFELKTLDGFKDSRPEPLAYLAKNYYQSSAPAYDKTVERSIFLHVSKNPAAEVRRAAAAIARLVKNGCRYRDITVAARDIDSYAGYIKRIFPIYSIPVFADAKRPLARHSAAGYVLSAMELAIYGFTHENVFGFAKNPFAPHGGSCGELEDYCVEAGIRSWNWGEDFTFIRGAYSSLDYGGEREPEDLTFINQRRGELVELMEPLRLCLGEKRSGKEFAKGLYEFMLSGGLPEKAEAAAKEQENCGDLRGGSETRQVYNLMIDILDDVCTVFGDREIDPEDFYEAFKTACTAVQIGVVPPSADSVTYGDIERMKGARDKYVFVLGLNEDVFPRAFADSSIFTEYEAEALREQWDIELPPMGAEKSENEKLLVYEAVSFAEKRLYLSYSLGKTDGGNLRPSPIVGRVRELFPKLRETEDVNSPNGEYLCATKAAAFLELGTAMGENRPEKFWSLVHALLRDDPIYGPKLRQLEKNMNYNSMETEDLDSELLKKVTGEELALSPSRLESYGGCPFSYFLQYILKLRDTAPMNINFADSGNILHNIIDGFCARVSRDLKGNWRKADASFTDRVFGEVCGEIRRGLSRQISADPRLKAAVERIEATARKCIEEIRT